MAAHWITAEQTNPLPIDWAQGRELHKKEVYERFLAELESWRGNIYILLQKVRAVNLDSGFIDFPKEELFPTWTKAEYYKVWTYVRDHFTKVDETELFTVYE